AAMPNYILIQEKHLSPPRPADAGFPAARRRIGILDFLRELEQETPGLAPYEDLRVDGLEDVLLAARPDVELMARHICAVLQRHASFLQDTLRANIQVVFQSQLDRGNKLCLGYPGLPLPVWLIFGTPVTEEVCGVPFYRASFNLTG
ncbi:hypothetical protein GX586_14865, partial [bacterium]|nr:hypothetical protein [bacterium]